MNNSIILKAIYKILPDENFVYGTPLESRELYIPPAHCKAL